MSSYKFLHGNFATVQIALIFRKFHSQTQNWERKLWLKFRQIFDPRSIFIQSEIEPETLRLEEEDTSGGIMRVLSKPPGANWTPQVPRFSAFSKHWSVSLVSYYFTLLPFNLRTNFWMGSQYSGSFTVFSAPWSSSCWWMPQDILGRFGNFWKQFIKFPRRNEYPGTVAVEYKVNAFYYNVIW